MRKAKAPSRLPSPLPPPVAGVEEALHNGGRPCARPEKYVFAWGWILILVVQGGQPRQRIRMLACEPSGVYIAYPDTSRRHQESYESGN